MFYSYILRTSGNTLYVGYTKDLERRLKQHKSHKGGAAYMRSFSDFALVYLEIFENQHDAMNREWHLKQLTHAQKERLIGNSSDEITRKIKTSTIE